MHSPFVVFPAPLRPTIPKISPARTVKLKSSTATVVPYVLRRCPTSITGCPKMSLGTDADPPGSL
jgi:hypothetical protein